MLAKPNIFSQVEPLEVIHSCDKSCSIRLVANVVADNGKRDKITFPYVGHTALVDEKFAFDYFGRRIHFGDKDFSEIEKIIEVNRSGRSSGDCFFVKLFDGTVSWAEVQRSFTYGMVGTLKPGDFTPPRGFEMIISLNPIGEACEWIKPFPDGMRFGYFATRFGKKGDEYFLLENGTGCKIDFLVDWNQEITDRETTSYEAHLTEILEDLAYMEQDDKSLAVSSQEVDVPKPSQAPQTRIDVFCSSPTFVDGKMFISAKVEGKICEFVIDPAYFDGCRLQPIK